MKPNPMTSLVSLIQTEEEFMRMHDRLKLSGEERTNGLFVLAHRKDKEHSNPLKPYKDLILLVSLSVNHLNLIRSCLLVEQTLETMHICFISLVKHVSIPYRIHLLSRGTTGSFCATGVGEGIGWWLG